MQSRPNCFVGLRVDDPALVQRLVAAQRRCIPATLGADTINPAKFHITLALLNLQTQEQGSLQGFSAAASLIFAPPRGTCGTRRPFLGVRALQDGA